MKLDGYEDNGNDKTEEESKGDNDEGRGVLNDIIAHHFVFTDMTLYLYFPIRSRCTITRPMEVFIYIKYEGQGVPEGPINL
jgi:hypothetical protein